MTQLDLRSPFDELTELRSLLTTQEIAELTGLRRETISRARPDRPFRRRTERAIGDLYLVVIRMRADAGRDLGHLAAILRRPQPLLGDSSIAELLREGKVDEVLRHFASPPAPAMPSKVDSQVATLLDGDPDLAGLLPGIEAKIRDHFGPDVRIERSLVSDPEEGDRLYLRIAGDHPLDERVERLTALLDQEESRLEPFQDRLTIGIS